jgi:hypothetical protein
MEIMDNSGFIRIYVDIIWIYKWIPVDMYDGYPMDFTNRYIPISRVDF